MGEIQPPSEVMRLVAVISRHEDALQWSHDKLTAAYGEIALASDRFHFTETSYYESSMGADLWKQFLVFSSPMDPESLAQAKHDSNAWEAEYRNTTDHAEPRPLNLDPGYLTQAKLVLATTKDRDHRIYLAKGIYAEVTLHYVRGKWEPWPWTYPDYRRDDFAEFFTRCREWLRTKGFASQS